MKDRISAYGVARFTFMILSIAVIIVCCSDDSTKPEDESGFAEVVSRLFSTYEGGSFDHPEGITVSVPVYAVPETEDGEEGSLHFVIESGDPESYGIPDEILDGSPIINGVADLGPESFTLQIPIRVTRSMPDTIDPGQHEIFLNTYDRIDGVWRSIGGQIDVNEMSIEADLLTPVPLGVSLRSVTDSAWGAIRVQSMDDYGFVMLIDSQTATYPQWDGSFDPTSAFKYIPSRNMSDESSETGEYWVLPQGGYRLVIAVYRFNPADTRDIEYLGYFYYEYVNILFPHWDRIGSGDPYENAVTLDDFSSWIDSGSLTPERPPGMGIVLPGYSSDELRVQLEWFSHADLDLWVADPCGNVIFYDDSAAVCDESEGRLIADNGCPWFTFGKPETIVWSGKPPKGEFIVYVDYFRDCGNAGEVFYKVWRAQGPDVMSMNGFISPPEIPGMQDDEKRVASFVIE